MFDFKNNNSFILFFKIWVYIYNQEQLKTRNYGICIKNTKLWDLPYITVKTFSVSDINTRY